MDKQDRKEVLLRAAYDLLLQAHEANTVVEVLVLTTRYDDADCDGFCVGMDIELELGIEGPFSE